MELPCPLTYLMQIGTPTDRKEMRAHNSKVHRTCALCLVYVHRMSECPSKRIDIKQWILQGKTREVETVTWQPPGQGGQDEYYSMTQSTTLHALRSRKEK
jgi:hypothetical protein